MASKKSVGRKVYEYWQRSFDSTRHRMSRGARHIFKTISWARNENWRRNDKKSKK